MSSTTINIEAVVPDKSKLQNICRFLENGDNNEDFHVESLIQANSKFFATVQFSTHSEYYNELVALVATSSELAGFELFRDQVGEQSFEAYKKGEQLSIKQSAFDKLLSKTLDELSTKSNSTELTPNQKRIAGSWVNSQQGEVLTWSFNGNRFIATAGTSKKPESKYRIEGEYEIGSDLVLMDDYDDDTSFKTECTPLTLLIEENRYDAPVGPFYVSCLFPKSNNKLWLEFNDFEFIEDITAPYGLSADKPVGTFERDDEMIFRRI